MISILIQFSSPGLSWAIIVWRHKNDSREAFRWQKPAETSWIVLNGDFSAQEKTKGLKALSLEPPQNEDSEYVFKIVIACIWTKHQRKMSVDTIFNNFGGQGCSVRQISPQR
jgi:hypothetical protein